MCRCNSWKKQAPWPEMNLPDRIIWGIRSEQGNEGANVQEGAFELSFRSEILIVSIAVDNNRFRRRNRPWMSRFSKS